jgi:photoactive yellow protein
MTPSDEPMTAAALTSPPAPSLRDVSLADLDAMSVAELDALPFGVIALDAAGCVESYNLAEGRYAGMKAEAVIGRHFFTAVAPCMNTALVAGRLGGEGAVDETIDYVLTFRMRPTRVKVRLVKSPASDHRYILIER